MKEAFDKIIERLEIESIMLPTTKLFYENPQNGAYVEEVVTLEDAIKIVNEVVKEHNDGWIPIDKELPTTSRKCWVTLDINGKLLTRQDCFHNGEWEISMNKYVVAWQYEEKPKPYCYAENDLL